ncbi:CobW family GTP-binding protein [Rummeliibacillus stabekisii]|uniref:CobW family GTP-binding protein n=1 Tax=Rummeliibacillus stabekisii TaxID=241244 RepID=UPI0011690CEF|nr:GTP-binding protein [Rummeliibacillus stabekisii]MBB5169028.1 G3E family GTPase [Rummeliibacillus stabekisii]GEL05668.1 cobalamin biosynthesis protein [Rummeliibacillus stabekisii]
MKDVYLFSGFLGSGKTTLLMNTIRQLKEQNLKPAIIMNELGALNFDSQAIEENIPLKEMLNGCICCTGAEKTEAQIQSLLADSEFDVLIIETTGAAHPVEALDAVYSPLFANELNIKGIVTVADSKRWLEREGMSIQTRSLFLEQIRHAHLILANKMDLLTESEMAKVTFEMQNINSHALIIQTTNASLPIKYLQRLQATARPASIQKATIGEHLHLGSRLVTFNSEESFTQEKFEEWIKTLPNSVYRMKGFVPIEGIRNPMLFQYAYGLTQWLPEYVKMEPNLVIIGENVNELDLPKA